MDYPDCKYRRLFWTDAIYNKTYHCTAMDHDKVEGAIINCVQCLYLELCPEGWR